MKLKLKIIVWAAPQRVLLFILKRWHSSFPEFRKLSLKIIVIFFENCYFLASRKN